ncbi:hypothetical protein [Parvularcula sp. LCG005]|uniref:hypothetical protein n=1 Tax=Parvularcula sp. LCG005 TaxID=3078805 RepID=UPI002942E642|nr:hypothetical protein [Parvularcula sp. LCG005]WOI52259.1 hypothetical protein RUI03_08850 [Parvularcula sp. LCG005]
MSAPPDDAVPPPRPDAEAAATGGHTPTGEGRTFTADRVGIAMAVIGAVLFSAKGLLAKFAYDDGMSPIALISFRMLMALPFFIVVGYGGWKKRRPTILTAD